MDVCFGVDWAWGRARKHWGQAAERDLGAAGVKVLVPWLTWEPSASRLSWSEGAGALILLDVW